MKTTLKTLAVAGALVLTMATAHAVNVGGEEMSARQYMALDCRTMTKQDLCKSMQAILFLLTRYPGKQGLQNCIQGIALAYKFSQADAYKGCSDVAEVFDLDVSK